MLRSICIFCLALTMICFIPRTYAQKGKSEISVDYGYYSIYSLVNGKPFNASSGVGMLNYKYYLTKKFTLGGVVGYENISSKGSYLTFAPEFTYTYYDNKDDRIRVRLYGSGSLGMTIFDDFFTYSNLYSQHHDESGPQVTGYASPFGIRIGRKVAGFFEVGVGYKGLVHGGFAYRFRTKKMAKTDN